MKFFNTKLPTFDKINLIIQEMINIETGMTYFENGVACDIIKPGHNTYKINDTSYEVHPNYGVVYVIQENETISARDIIDAHTTLVENYEDEKKVNLFTNTGIGSTSQYMCIRNPQGNLYNRKYIANIEPLSKMSGSTVFTWCIYTRFNKTRSRSLYIPHFNSKRVNVCDQLLSLSSIIYDSMDALYLNHGYTSPDLPDINAYNSYRNGYICDKVFNVSTNKSTGVMCEIASHFVNVGNKVYNASLNYHDCIDTSVFWLNFSDVRPFHTVQCDLPWYEQINRGMLQPYSNTGYENMSANKLAKTHNYTCIITGIPIYEDCYVLDIYEQSIIKTISINDLKQAQKNGAKIYNSIPSDASHTKKQKDDRFVEILVKVTHEKPLHVFISAYAVYKNHCSMYSHNSQRICFTELNKMTMTKYIAHRSFCPRTADDVIDTLKSSEVYKQCLTAANKSMRSGSYEIDTRLGCDGNTILVRNISAMDVIYANPRKCLVKSDQ